MPIELKELVELLGVNKPSSQSHSFEIGKAYFIRTATYFALGRLVRVTDTDVVLEDASWIADTGRFSTMLNTGSVNECEPFLNDAIIFRGAMVDATEWKHKLPREQK